MALFIIGILCPSPPGDQPVGDLHVAQSAILLGFVNGLVSPDYMRGCLCGSGDARCGDAAGQEEMYYQLANFVLAMLGVALLLVDRTFSDAVVRSPLLPVPPVVRGMVWLAKVLTGATVQFGLHVLHLCLKMLCARLMLVFNA